MADFLFELSYVRCEASSFIPVKFKIAFKSCLAYQINEWAANSV